MLAEEYVEMFDELGIYDHRGAPTVDEDLSIQKQTYLRSTSIATMTWMCILQRV